MMPGPDLPALSYDELMCMNISSQNGKPELRRAMELEVRGLTKQFGPVTAVRDVSFTAPAGQVTGLLGPNGSGKTTTLRVALGLVRPSAGAALIGGVPYQSLRCPRRT